MNREKGSTLHHTHVFIQIFLLYNPYQYCLLQLDTFFDFVITRIIYTLSTSRL